VTYTKEIGSEKSNKLADVKIATDEHGEAVAGEGDRTRSDE